MPIDDRGSRKRLPRWRRVLGSSTLGPKCSGIWRTSEREQSSCVRRPSVEKRTDAKDVAAESAGATACILALGFVRRRRSPCSVRSCRPPDARIPADLAEVNRDLFWAHASAAAALRFPEEAMPITKKLLAAFSIWPYQYSAAARRRFELRTQMLFLATDSGPRSN